MDEEDTSKSNEDNNKTDSEIENKSNQIRKKIVEAKVEKFSKKVKKGILYLSKIPKYMNIAMIREIFSTCGKVDKIYLQLAENGWS